MKIIILILAVVFLTVSGAYALDVKLLWEPVTTNIDGTPITDLEGYRIRFGDSSGNYISNIDVGNVTEKAILDLPEGKNKCFVVTAYDTSGNESDYSNEACLSEFPAAPTGTRIRVTIDITPLP